MVAAAANETSRQRDSASTLPPPRAGLRAGRYDDASRGEVKNEDNNSDRELAPFLRVPGKHRLIPPVVRVVRRRPSPSPRIHAMVGTGRRHGRRQ